MSRIKLGPALASLTFLLLAGCGDRSATSSVPEDPVLPSLGLSTIPIGSSKTEDAHRFVFELGSEVDQVGAAQPLPTRHSWLLTWDALYASDPHQEGNVPLTPTISVGFSSEAQSHLGLGPSRAWTVNDSGTEYVTGDDASGWRQRFLVRELAVIDPPWTTSHLTGFDADRATEDLGGGVQRVTVGFTPRDAGRFGTLTDVPHPRGEVWIYGELKDVVNAPSGSGWDWADEIEGVINAPNGSGWDWTNELEGIRFTGPVVVDERRTFVVDLLVDAAASSKPRVDVRLISENGLLDQAVPDTDAASIVDGTLGTATFSAGSWLDSGFTRVLREEWITTFAPKAPAPPSG